MAAEIMLKTKKESLIALEETLKRKLSELQTLCIKESELTEKLQNNLCCAPCGSETPSETQMRSRQQLLTPTPSSASRASPSNIDQYHSSVQNNGALNNLTNVTSNMNLYSSSTTHASCGSSSGSTSSSNSSIVSHHVQPSNHMISSHFHSHSYVQTPVITNDNANVNNRLFAESIKGTATTISEAINRRKDPEIQRPQLQRQPAITTSKTSTRILHTLNSNNYDEVDSKMDFSKSKISSSTNNSYSSLLVPSSTTNSSLSSSSTNNTQQQQDERRKLRQARLEQLAKSVLTQTQYEGLANLRQSSLQQKQEQELQSSLQSARNSNTNGIGIQPQKSPSLSTSSVLLPDPNIPANAGPITKSLSSSTTATKTATVCPHSRQYDVSIVDSHNVVSGSKCTVYHDIEQHVRPNSLEVDSCSDAGRGDNYVNIKTSANHNNQQYPIATFWEETKPYELSDFYKYSAKHRKKLEVNDKDTATKSALTTSVHQSSNRYPQQRRY